LSYHSSLCFPKQTALKNFSELADANGKIHPGNPAPATSPSEITPGMVACCAQLQALAHQETADT
jgi:hypothetical protein